MVYPDIFKNIDDVIEHLNNQGWSLSKCYNGKAEYELMDFGNGKIIYYPKPFATPLFRGQNTFWEPCLASYYRSDPDEVEKFNRQLLIEEFRIVISKHPVIKEDIEGGIYVDYTALAQHYEFQTEMLDLTNSLPVAAFFAVTKKEGNEYLPMPDSKEPGVLYFISPDRQFDFITETEELEIYPVGWQIFKRPGEQRAFGVNLSNYKNLNTMPGVFAYRFYHEKKISEKIYEVFHGGRDLFPKDIFAERAARVKGENIFSLEAFNVAYKNINTSISKEEVLIELKKKNIKIQKECPYEYSKEDIETIRNLYQSGELTKDLNATVRISYTPNK